MNRASASGTRLAALSETSISGPPQRRLRDDNKAPARPVERPAGMAQEGSAPMQANHSTPHRRLLSSRLVVLAITRTGRTMPVQSLFVLGWLCGAITVLIGVIAFGWR